jgi:hypothetical protein
LLDHGARLSGACSVSFVGPVSQVGGGTELSASWDPPRSAVRLADRTRLSGCWWDQIIWQDLDVRSVAGTCLSGAWDLAVRSVHETRLLKFANLNSHVDMTHK